MGICPPGFGRKKIFQRDRDTGQRPAVFPSCKTFFQLSCFRKGVFKLCVSKRIYRGNIIYAIALIVLGLVFAVWPADSRSVLIRILGVLFVLSGLAVAYTFFRNRTPGQLPMVLIAGIILAILGVLIIVRPESFVEFIIILAGAFILLSGIMNFCQTLSLALLHYRYWWIGMIISILTIMLSVLVMTKPGKIADIVFIITGASMIYDGATNLWVAMKLRWFSRKVREGISDTVDGQY